MKVNNTYDVMRVFDYSLGCRKQECNDVFTLIGGDNDAFYLVQMLCALVIMVYYLVIGVKKTCRFV